MSVADSGNGIKSWDLKKIFERYYRVDHSSNVSGFGISLYLSAEIVRRHRWEIWAESEVGIGSFFKFTIPLVGSLL